MNRGNTRSAHPAGSSPAHEFGDLQKLVDELFETRESVERLDIIMRAEIDDLSDDLLEVVHLLPAGRYKRGRLCDQINSILSAHGWGLVYGNVE